MSVANITDWEIGYGIVGHSERRQYFEESHQDVANKVSQLIDAGITPIVCIDDEYLVEQAAAIEKDQLKQCVVAYEPLEAIGSGVFQPVDEVEPIVNQIKEVFGEVPVLYGGSVDAENVAQYLAVTDGVLVGGASLDANEFAALMRSCYSDTE